MNIKNGKNGLSGPHRPVLPIQPISAFPMGHPVDADGLVIIWRECDFLGIKNGARAAT